jgi:hypothetical protein
MINDWKDREIEKCRWLLNEKINGTERNSVLEYLKSLDRDNKS